MSVYLWKQKHFLLIFILHIKTSRKPGNSHTKWLFFLRSHDDHQIMNSLKFKAYMNNVQRSVERKGHSLDSLAYDMFVEWPSEVTLQKFVIIHSLGDDATHELVVAEVVAVAVRGRVDCVGDPVSWWCTEQSIHGVEDFPGYDDVPLS